MRKNKDIEPFNDKDQPHGLWEWYYDGNLMLKRFYHNGERVGYEEWYDGKLKEKKYYL
jgi:hypothetical protein